MNEANVNYLPDVEFRGQLSDENNCVCSACHKMGFVLKLTVPDTGYHDGKHLSTRCLTRCNPGDVRNHAVPYRAYQADSDS